jgi:hypothetical protein
MANIPDRGSPVPASSPRPEESQPSPLPPGSATVDGAHHDNRSRSRLLFKKFLRPIVLTVIGVGLFLVAMALYPRQGELPTPSSATVQLSVPKISISTISYRVSQISTSVARITVQVQLAPHVHHPPAKGPGIVLFLFLPPGMAFKTCPTGFCHFIRGSNVYYWGVTLNFNGVNPVNNGGVANATLFVKAHRFGYAHNRINAAAAIPGVFLNGARPIAPELYVEYNNATSANRYDWSGLPTDSASGTKATWVEPVTSGGAPGRVAVGVNHANEAIDSNKTFFAGALIGLAGGALLSAVQEALHASD